MRRDQSRGRGGLGWLTDIFRQVFSDREIISPGMYCAYNAFAGVILLAASVLMWVEPGFGTARAAVVAGIVAVVLISAVPVARRRPSAVPRLLALHGVIFVLLGFWFAAECARWALFAPPRAPFRYAPGLTLALFTYGALQVAGFGPWASRARPLRIMGLAAGVVYEVVVGVALLLRAFKA